MVGLVGHERQKTVRVASTIANKGPRAQACPCRVFLAVRSRYICRSVLVDLRCGMTKKSGRTGVVVSPNGAVSDDFDNGGLGPPLASINPPSHHTHHTPISHPSPPQSPRL